MVSQLLKPVIYSLVALIIVGIILVFIRRMFKDKGLDRQEAKTVDQEIRQKEKEGVKASVPLSVYKDWADTIYDSMNGSALAEGSNSNIYRTFELVNNEVDLLNLKKAYGTRQLYTFGFPDKQPMTLAQALSYEDHIQDVRKILSKKGLSI